MWYMTEIQARIPVSNISRLSALALLAANPSAPASFQLSVNPQVRAASVDPCSNHVDRVCGPVKRPQIAATQTALAGRSQTDMHVASGGAVVESGTLARFHGERDDSSGKF